MVAESVAGYRIAGEMAEARAGMREGDEAEAIMSRESV